MSSREDRLGEAYRLYQDAWRNLTHDLAEALSPAQTDALMKNLRAAETAYLQAARQSLANTGPQVEAAFQQAKEANDAVVEARKQAQGIAARIRALTSATKKVAEFVRKAW